MGQNLSEVAREAKINDLGTFLCTTVRNDDGAAIIFKSEEAIDHFTKHGYGVRNALDKTSCHMKEYMMDAPHVMKTGQYAPELRG